MRFRARRLENRLTVPLQLQINGPDHLDDGRDGIARSGNLVRLGIESPHERHGPVRGGPVVRVPADEVVHIYRIE